MLTELYIENLAVIEKAAIPFSNKLNIFSGETGAGKSILIGGINAILGGRVNKDIVRAGAEKAQVSALFSNIPDEAARVITESGYTIESSELVLMREISADGKSIARINGKTATAAILREVAGMLIDIHGQHDTRMLMNGDNQRSILDNYGNLNEKISEYSEYFKEFQILSRKMKKLEAEDSLKEQKIEILTEKIKEVDSYKLVLGEEDIITAELKALQNNEEIEQCLGGAYYEIAGESDNNAIDKLRKSRLNLETVSDIIPKNKNLGERLKSVIIELDDIKSELAALKPLGFDKARLAFLEERASDMTRLRRKFNMTIDELIIECDKWKDELGELEFSDDMRKKLSMERKTLGDKVKLKGGELTELRKNTAEMLVKAITAELEYLNMPDVKFMIAVNQDRVTINGMDSVEMLISVNKGEEPKPIQKIASGGELSRIMLAIKAVLAENDDIPTMIFDEIDTGISGRAAQKVGVKLREISRRRQVLCVTHLAQIAAMADKHLMIEKTSGGERTYTRIADLDESGRKKELARIISGNSESEISIKNAEELLEAAKKIKIG